MLVEEYPDKISRSRHWTLLSSPTTYNIPPTMTTTSFSSSAAQTGSCIGLTVMENMCTNWIGTTTKIYAKAPSLTSLSIAVYSVWWLLVTASSALPPYTLTVSFSGTLALESLWNFLHLISTSKHTVFANRL